MIVGRDCVVLGLLVFVVVAVTVMSSSSLLWSLCWGSSCGGRGVLLVCFVGVHLMLAPVGSYVSAASLFVLLHFLHARFFADWVLLSIGNSIPAINAV